MNRLQIAAAGGRGPVAAEMRLDVIRCGCTDKSVPVHQRHGGTPNDPHACPNPANIERDARVLRWKARDYTWLAFLIIFALGVALTLFVQQAWPIFLMLGATLQVNGGRGIVTARLRGIGTEPLNIGWGTGAGTTAAADTTLFTEALVTLAAGTTDHTVGTSSQTTTSTTNDTYQVVGTRTATGAGTVTNAGLWDAASGGTLYMKGDFTGIVLASGDAIQFTCKVQFT